MLSFKTPFEVLFGFFIKYDHLCVFGCLCYPNTSSISPYKLSPRSIACIYLGQATDHKGHKFLDLVTHRIIISRHVIFDEDDFPYCNFHLVPSDSEYDQFTSNDDTPPTFPSLLVSPNTYHMATPTPSLLPSPPHPPSRPPNHPMTIHLRTGSLTPRVLLNLSTTSYISPILRSTS